MRLLIVILFLAIPIFCQSFIRRYNTPSEAHCLWHDDSCVEECPDWMVKRKCDCTKSYWKALQTCEHPDVAYVSTVCNFSRCECPDLMVLDTNTGHCYELDNCPTRHDINIK